MFLCPGRGKGFVFLRKKILLEKYEGEGLINNSEHYAVTRRITIRCDSMAVHKERHNDLYIQVNEHNAAGIKKEEDQRRPTAVALRWIHFLFFWQDFHPRKRFERACRIYEKGGKERRKKAETRKRRLTRPSHASPSHLHYIYQPFFEFPLIRRRPYCSCRCFFTGLCSLKTEDGT